MWSFREPDEPDYSRVALTFGLGALGGLAIGLLLSGRGRARASEPRAQLGTRLRESARSMAQRLGPARLQREPLEQNELTALEDAVLDAFLADGVLGERGIDVGAISRGIVELSGTVETEEESAHAVRVANRVPGVQTVVNRLEVGSQARHLDDVRRRFEAAEEDDDFGEWSGRNIGMGRRRQGTQTDPARPDDSQHFREVALAEADEGQWTEEELAYRKPVVGARERQLPERNHPDFAEDELDNQDPHGKHAPVTLDEQPQQLNTQARVGQGLPPGLELTLEQADVPVKPHGSGAAGGSDAATE